MVKNPAWWEFQEHIADRLKELDPSARSTKGSGNKGEQGDVNNKCGLTVECKQRNTKSVTINIDTWKKLLEEIPLHSERIPLYALENKDKKRWAVLDLDDFLDIYVELIKYRRGEKQ
jgi:hypothetical protein